VDPASIWPDFEDDWILYEDEALVAVDKPAGIPSQAADPDQPDDLVTRLRTHLAAQGRDPYLGVHQRLDKDTSGVVVMTRRRDANPAVAAQFEGRRVDKRYLAAVKGWSRKGEAVRRDWLAPGDGGRMRVAREGQRGAELAVTRVRVANRSADRALLDVRIETGKTHQIRVQLEHAGAPVAGDRLYGGPEASRLMLHASEIGLTHPTTGKPLRVTSPAPPELDEWVKAGDAGPRMYDDGNAIICALASAVRRRYALGRSQGDHATTAFRLVNGAGDALPGLVVDVHADWLVAEFEGDDAELFGREGRKTRVLDGLDSLGFDGVYLKVRPKQSSTLVDTRREDLAPKLPVRGTAAPFDVTVLENGIPYGVRLGDGLQTGLFLDQRLNRLRVREASKDKRVANLFAYTCAFSVAAARGGARETVSVDASVTALERGRHNFELAGVAPGSAHTFAAEDVFAWVARTRKRGTVFDIVILDPPSYSSTKKRRFVAKTDYRDLATDVMRLIAPHGSLLACVNHRGIGRERFRKHLYEAARAAGREVLQAKDLPTPSDFPPPLGGESHLKAVWVRLG
jgi:23S rRNA (cytosine1962-C5)-methyltransferase